MQTIYIKKHNAQKILETKHFPKLLLHVNYTNTDIRLYLRNANISTMTENKFEIKNVMNKVANKPIKKLPVKESRLLMKLAKSNSLSGFLI